MPAGYWNQVIRELSSARAGLLESPVHALPGVEDLLEKLCAQWDVSLPPNPAQASEIHLLLAEILALAAHGAELVNGWRAAFDSVADVYDIAGAPVNRLFSTQNVSTRG